MRMGGAVIFFFSSLNFACLKCLAAGLEVVGVSFRKEDIHNVWPMWTLSCEKDVRAVMQRNGDWEAAERAEATVGGCLGPKASVSKWL